MKTIKNIAKDIKRLSILSLGLILVFTPLGYGGGFDHIGYDPATGFCTKVTQVAIPLLAHSLANGFSFYDFVVDRTFIPHDLRLKKISMAIDDDNSQNLSSALGYEVRVYSGTPSSLFPQAPHPGWAFDQTPLSGDILDVTFNAPTFGSATQSCAPPTYPSSVGNPPLVVRVGFDVPPTVLSGGEAYTFSVLPIIDQNNFILSDDPRAVRTLDTSPQSSFEGGWIKSGDPITNGGFLWDIAYPSETAFWPDLQHIGYAAEGEERINQGPGCGANPNALPEISPDFPVIAQNWTVTGTNMPPNSTGELLVSLGSFQATPIGGGCNAYLDISNPTTNIVTLTQFTTDSSGNWSYQLPIPNASSLVGATFTLQAVAYDPQAPINYAMSNGVTITIGN
ncbi:MAG: hypothetical protein D6710_11495 [Nitrospirae bacterium]|nr:MAG: hypothetical protein D6710_11495 [Nitrospirota bacterium]